MKLTSKRFRLCESYKGITGCSTSMTTLYKMYSQSLSWMGGNLNQIVKRANELAIGQTLSTLYFQKVLYPKVQEVEALLIDIKDRMYETTHWMTK